MSKEKITISVKMVICGNVGVGKTSLFTRINNLEYNQNPQSTSNDYQRKTYQKDKKNIFL
jgi:GTPase SAR1 family protein